MSTLAGHTFDGLAFRCIRCGRAEADVLGATEDAIGEFGWTCDGSALSLDAFAAIAARREAIAQAIVAVSSR